MTRCDAIRKLLSDGRWHSMTQVMFAGGWRYAARLHDLRQRGFDHETKCERGCWWYRRAR